MEKEYNEYLKTLKAWIEETKDTKLEAMDQFFAKRVDGYEEHMSPWKECYKSMADLVPEKTKKLLDIGCGTGLELDEIFDVLPNVEVTGIDLSNAMLERLENKHYNKNISLVCGDYFKKPFGEKCYDVAVSFQTLHHFKPEKKLGVFKKLYNCLKNGGCYIQCDYMARTQEIEELLFVEGERRRVENKILDEEFIHFDTPLTLKHETDLIRNAGFESVDCIGNIGDDNTAIIVAWKKQQERYTYSKDYKDDDILRKSFMDLAQKTFGIDFEKWYLNDFWREKYITHSMLYKNKVIANVSVNLMDFYIEGVKKKYIQLGTIMTDNEYRGQGLSRYLIEKVIEEYNETVDGIYLFANDNVLEFYPKFGFSKINQYQYSKSTDNTNSIKKVKHINMCNKENWKKLFKALNMSISNEKFAMDNFGLFAFYTTGFLKESVYYFQDEDIFIIADIEQENLFIHQIIASYKVDLEKVIESFGKKIKKVTLGFTPSEVNGFNIEKLKIEDTTLFIRGKDLQMIQNDKLMFPSLSHA